MLVMQLEVLGHDVESVGCAEEALGRFIAAQHELVLTDCQMPGMSGAELADEVKQRSPRTPILMCSGHPTYDCSAIDGFVAKPVSLESLRKALDRVGGPPCPSDRVGLRIRT